MAVIVHFCLVPRPARTSLNSCTMKNNFLFFLVLLCSIFSLSSCYTSYYYVVRHAEKASAPAENPPLTLVGQQRAIALCDTLRDKKVHSIFVSQYLRTQQTAQPSANLLQISPIQYNASEPVEDLVMRLRANSRPNTLVVGHSNTVPGIILSLTGTAINPISDNDYDNLFIIKRVHKWKRSTYTLFRTGTYGLDGGR